MAQADSFPLAEELASMPREALLLKHVLSSLLWPDRVEAADALPVASWASSSGVCGYVFGPPGPQPRPGSLPWNISLSTFYDLKLFLRLLFFLILCVCIGKPFSILGLQLGVFLIVFFPFVSGLLSPWWCSGGHSQSLTSPEDPAWENILESE